MTVADSWQKDKEQQNPNRNVGGGMHTTALECSETYSSLQLLPGEQVDLAVTHAVL